MGKHAYLIEAHNNKHQLELLLKCLDYQDNDIYLHIDSKSKELKNFGSNIKLKYSNLKLIDSVEVHWGGFSQIQTELNLLEAAILGGNYSRFHLISGVDMPLKSQKEIHDFFDKRKKQEFIHFDYDNSPTFFSKRMAQYHFLRDKIDRKNKILNLIEKISVQIQSVIGVNRIHNFNIDLKKGANWFSITADCAKYILEKKEWIINTFKFTKCCDEIFMQTLLYNSKFKENFYYDEHEKRNSNMRYTDWKRGNPYVFREEDFSDLINSHYIFARKFDEKIDMNIIKKIYSHITKNKD